MAFMYMSLFSFIIVLYHEFQYKRPHEAIPLLLRATEDCANCLQESNGDSVTPAKH